MNKWEKKCEKLCREIVMQVGWCEICGLTVDLKQHHGVLKSSQRYKMNPFVWHDPTLQFCLCDECHKSTVYSPHINPEAFMVQMATTNPDKVKRLRAVNSSPMPPAIDARFVDWKMVFGNLIEHGRPVGNEISKGCG